MKVLITSGGTEEPIDGVRYITNFSTGKTGAAIADRLTELGAEVTLLHGKRAFLPENPLKKHSFTDFRSLDERLQALLSAEDFDAVIHLAAVSDFSVDFIETEEGKRIVPDARGKISSDGKSLNLHLKRNYKILQKLKDYNGAKKDLLVVGFKLTDTDSVEEMESAVKKQLEEGHVDLVVHNNLRDITAAKHPARIYVSNGSLLYRTETKEELAEKLFQLMKEKGY
ncbi:MAG: NAD-dependent epimerase/dehydratase family protein [Spirochaetales bacterium]|nr:NAD-dependent epimerase/dehydratase family protein [Spirochaetales bacterium]